MSDTSFPEALLGKITSLHAGYDTWKAGYLTTEELLKELEMFLESTAFGTNAFLKKQGY